PHISKLGDCAFELGLSLRHDDWVDETVPELNGQQADLLSICIDGLRQDLDLCVQGPKRVVVPCHVGLDNELDHCEIICAHGRLRPGGLQRPADSAPDVHFVREVNGYQPIVDNGPVLHPLATDCTFTVCRQTLTQEGR